MRDQCEYLVQHTAAQSLDIGAGYLIRHTKLLYALNWFSDECRNMRNSPAVFNPEFQATSLRLFLDWP